ncbi:hypothetical protein DV735_g5695, partial [Chaetothyriales sp. CBS 134920]
MVSATDIITYIGVPLAVLGVLPILYTFILSIFTRRRIRNLLIAHGHTPLSPRRRSDDGFSIRSSPMTSLVEVELPQYTIAPLERNHDEYWHTTTDELLDDERPHQPHQALLVRAQSSLSAAAEEGRVASFLRGGSWRAFHWKRLTVGRKLYRIQYEDELREPAAEIDFYDLVHFLLDWGAVPDAMGWEKLRANGLWTPAGTVLLRKPGDEPGVESSDSIRKGGAAIDWVLRTSVPDESDGILSLTIRWSRDEGEEAGDGKKLSRNDRGASSLPPGWGRLTQPVPLEVEEQAGAPSDRTDLPTRIQRLKAASKHALNSSTSFRFRAEDSTVSQVHWERVNVATGAISLPFSGMALASSSAASAWFASAAASVLAMKTPPMSLWHFEIPPSILSIARRDSVPCGIMVVLGLLHEDRAPQWSSQLSSSVNPVANLSRKHHQRFMAETEALRLEALMPPEQARIAKLNREQQRFRDLCQDMVDQANERSQSEERRIIDAIASPRISSKAVAEACLAWLIDRGEIGREWTVADLAEAVLYLLVLDSDDYIKNDDRKADAGGDTDAQADVKPSRGQAAKVIQLLIEWQDWCNAGGMKRQHFSMLDECKVEFCFAASLVSVIAGSSNASASQAGKAMMECVKSWRKVRLG